MRKNITIFIPMRNEHYNIYSKERKTLQYLFQEKIYITIFIPRRENITIVIPMRN